MILPWRGAFTAKERLTLLFENLEEILCLVILFGLPLFFLPNIFTTFELAKVFWVRSLVVLMVIVVGLKSLKRKKRKKGHVIELGLNLDKKFGMNLGSNLKKTHLPRAVFLLLMSGIIFLVWYGLATLFSAAPMVSFIGLYPRFQGLYSFGCYLIFGGFIFFILRKKTAIGQSEIFLKRLSSTMIMAAAITSFIALFAFFLPKVGINFLNFWDTDIFLGRVFGTMGHPDFLAGFLIMVIPQMICEIFQQKNSSSKKIRVMMWVALILSLITLYLTSSRAAFLGLNVALIVIAALYGKKIGNKKILFGALIFPLIIIIGLIGLQLVNHSWVKNTFAERFVFQGENLRSWQSRLSLWQGTLRLIAEHPLLGYGPDTFALVFPKYAPVKLNFSERLNDIPDRAHNEFLDLAVNIGIPGMLAGTFFFIFLLVVSVRKILSPDPRWLHMLGIIGGLAALFVNNLFSFSTTVVSAYMASFVAIVLSFIWPVRMIDTHHRDWKLNIFAKFFICLGLVILGGWWWHQDFQALTADYWYRVSFDLRNAGKNGEAIMALEKAQMSAPFQSFYAMALANIFISDNKFGDAFEQAQIATQLRHEDVYSLIIRAKVETGLQKYDLALADFEKAATKAPHYPQLYLEWGKSLLAAQQYQKAVDIFNYYLAIVPDFYRWKGHFAELSAEDQNRYRIFYKLNPDFDKVFEYLQKALNMKI